MAGSNSADLLKDHLKLDKEFTDALRKTKEPVVPV